MNKVISVYELLGLIKDNRDKEVYCNYIDNNTGKENIMWACVENIIDKLDNKIISLNDMVEIPDEYKYAIEPITLDDWCEITYNENWELLKNDFNKNMRTIFDRLDKIIDYINEKEKKLEEKTKIEKISINGKDIHKLEKLGIYEVIEDIESTLNEIIDKLEKESK